MKNSINFNYVKKVSLHLSLSLSVLVIVNCTTEEITNSEEGNTNLFEATNASFATPKDGKIYSIRNRKSGRHMNIKGSSNSNGANLVQWGTTVTSKQTQRHFEVIDVGNGYVRIKGVDSGKSLEVKNGSNSNGANVEQRAYDNKTHQEWQILPTSNGYFRIKGRDGKKSMAVEDASTSNGANIEVRSWNGADKFQWFFTEIGSSSDNSGGGNDDDDNSGSGTASNIIGNGWKLNGFSGSLSVGNNDNGLDYADSASFGESHFFFERNGYAAFRCYPGNPTSGGSSNPRTELREVIGGGDGYWNGNTGTEHSMKWRFKIEDLPPSGKLAFGQIHERSDSFDDVIRVQVEGSEGQNSGDVTLRILGYVTEKIEGSGKSIDFDMKMDTEYYFELTMKNGVVSLYDLNNNGNRTKTLFKSVDIGNADENYFKAGCYLQSTQSDHEDSNVYGQVLIKDLKVSPDN